MTTSPRPVSVTPATRPGCPARLSSLPPLTAGDVAEILRSIPSRPDYEEWIQVIAAVGNELKDDEAAASVLNAWSPEESAGEYTCKLRSRLKHVGIGTLIHKAKEHGFDASAFTRRRAKSCAGRPMAPRPVPKAPAPPPPAPAKKQPRYTRRPGTTDEFTALATLRNLPSSRRPRRNAGRRVPGVRGRPQRHRR